MTSRKQEPIRVHGCDHNTTGSDGNLLSGVGCKVGGGVEELFPEDAVQDGGGVVMEGLVIQLHLLAFQLEGSWCTISNITRRMLKCAHLNYSSTRCHNPIHLHIAQLKSVSSTTIVLLNCQSS
jgi:hypothetical protein